MNQMFPQRLKPRIHVARNGAAEAAPLQELFANTLYERGTELLHKE